MATINLRPWREERAQQRQKQFIANLLVAAVIAGAIVLGVGFYFDTMKDRQVERNNFLKSETAKLDKQITEIKELRLKKERLLERLNAIQDLQGTRPLIVRNFDELVRVLPDSVFYKSLSRRGNGISISGTADNNLDVSVLMRNLDESIWFGEPQLSNIAAASEKRSFSLSVPIVKPKAEEIEGN